MGLISRLFGYIWDFFVDAALNILAAGIDTDPTTLLLIVGGITIWLGAACWASSIAETRLHSPKLHFFIGLLLPVFYPVVLLFAMDVDLPNAGGPGASSAPASAADAWEQESDADGEGEGGGADEEEDNAPEYDQAYFAEIARDETGNFVGPWRISFADNEVVARKILDPLPHVVVVETVPSGPRGKSQRLRIPYDKIESCVRA